MKSREKSTNRGATYFPCVRMLRQGRSWVANLMSRTCLEVTGPTLADVSCARKAISTGVVFFFFGFLQAVIHKEIYSNFKKPFMAKALNLFHTFDGHAVWSYKLNYGLFYEVWKELCGYSKKMVDKGRNSSNKLHEKFHHLRSQKKKLTVLKTTKIFRQNPEVRVLAQSKIFSASFQSVFLGFQLVKSIRLTACCHVDSLFASLCQYYAVPLSCLQFYNESTVITQQRPVFSREKTFWGAVRSCLHCVRTCFTNV